MKNRYVLRAVLIHKRIPFLYDTKLIVQSVNAAQNALKISALR